MFDYRLRNIRCPSRWVKTNTPEESLQKTSDNVKYSKHILIIDTIDKKKKTQTNPRTDSADITFNKYLKLDLKQKWPIPSIYTAVYLSQYIECDAFSQFWIIINIKSNWIKESQNPSFWSRPFISQLEMPSALFLSFFSNIFTDRPYIYIYSLF